MNTVILDTSAFLQGYNPVLAKQQYTVPGVRAEIKGKMAQLRYDNALHTGYLREIIPEKKYVETILKMIKEEGELKSLSETDIQLISLALQLQTEDKNPIIVSDDYSIQNIASKLKIKYFGFSTPGIKKSIKWTIYCPGCKKVYEEYTVDKKCLICGTELKRKPKK
jgi:UPF0271 protein